MVVRFSWYFHIDTREWLSPGWRKFDAWTERVADGTRSVRFCVGPLFFGASVKS